MPTGKKTPGSRSLVYDRLRPAKGKDAAHSLSPDRNLSDNYTYTYKYHCVSIFINFDNIPVMCINEAGYFALQSIPQFAKMDAPFYTCSDFFLYSINSSTVRKVSL